MDGNRSTHAPEKKGKEITIEHFKLPPDEDKGIRLEIANHYRIEIACAGGGP